MTTTAAADVTTINELTKTLADRVRRIDEDKLNAIFDRIPDARLTDIVRRKLPKPCGRRTRVVRHVPPALKSAIRDLGLTDEPDHDRRAVLFIGHCRYMGYSYNTVTRYLNILKSTTVLDAEKLAVRPSRFGFVDSGKVHQRSVSTESFSKLCRYVHDNLSRYTAPILVAIYTGLRTFEILQWSTLILHQLRGRQQYISVSRKRTFAKASRPSSRDDGGDDDDDDDCDGGVDGGEQPEYWRPVYSTFLTQFIDQMSDLYAVEYNEFRASGVVTSLFYVGHRTLVNRVRRAFHAANGFAPPNGFGIHSCRNMIAMIMAQNTDNMTAIQAFLQHKNISTTRNYIHADFRHISSEFNRLTKNEFATVLKNLSAPPEDRGGEP